MRDKNIIPIAYFALLPLLVGIACTCGLLPFGRDASAPIVEEIELAVAAPTDIVAEAIVEEPDVAEIILDETIIEESQVVVIAPGEELIALDFSWLQEERDVFVGFYLKNQYQDKNLESINYQIKLFNADGEEMRTEKNSFPWLFPDQTVGIAYRTYLPEDAPPVDSVTIDFEYRNSSASDDFVNPFNVEKIKIWDSGGSARPTLTAIIRNNSSTIFTTVRANFLCRDATGVIVGGGNTIIRFVPGNGGMVIKEVPFVYGEVATIEIYPIITNNSKTIDDTPELWESISIIDHNYEETRFRNLYGGVIIKNNHEDMGIIGSIGVVIFYDQEGFATTYGIQEIPYLFPGSSMGIAPFIYAQPLTATTTDYEWIILPGEQIDDYELEENIFSTNSAEITGSSNQYVLVNFTNTYDKSASQADIFVMLFDESGMIIGGGRKNKGSVIEAGETAEEQVNVYYSRDTTIAEIKVWVLPTLWTKYE